MKDTEKIYLDLLTKIDSKMEDTKDRVDAVKHKIDLHVAKSASEVNRTNEHNQRFSDTFERHVEDDRRANDHYINLLGKISEQVEESNQCIAKLDKKMDLNIQKLQMEVQAINILDEQQNKQLEIHIAASDYLKKLYEEQKVTSERRFEKLEEPGKVLKFFKRSLIGLGAMAGAIYGIVKAYEHFWK